MRERHTVRRVSYTQFINACERCGSLLSKIYDKDYVTVFCSRVGACEKVA